MNLTEVTELLTRHVAILNNPAVASRTPDIASVYAENLRFVDPHGEFTGRSNLNAFIDNLHQQFPCYVFRLAAPIEFHHAVARLNWEFGPPAQPASITGQDIVLLADGCIQTLYIFIDGATQSRQVLIKQRASNW
jgi:hypothetical protein